MKPQKQEAPAQLSRKVMNKATYKPGKGTKITGQSETIQNDTLSVSQLLLKHINGGEIKSRQGQYYEEDPDHDDPDIQQFSQMDLAERIDVLEGVKAMTTRLKNLEKEWIEEDRKRKEAQLKGPEGGG